ncbi:MAG: archaellin/type IV pilin N-terminal domain-containing protein [Sulfolobales archaeon]
MVKPKISRRIKAIVGIESAIVLIAFVVVAAALAFVVLNMGFFTTQKSKETIGSGLGEASSALEIDGTVVAGVNISGSSVTYFYIPLKLSAGKASIDVTPGKSVVSLWSPTKGYTYGDIYVATLTSKLTDAGQGCFSPASFDNTTIAKNAVNISVGNQNLIGLTLGSNTTNSNTYCLIIASYNTTNTKNITDIRIINVTYNDYLAMSVGSYPSPDIVDKIASSLSNILNRSVAVVAWVSNRNNDNVLDPGEKVILLVHLNDKDQLGAYDLFKVEFKIPVGASLTVERSVPASLNQQIIDLG